MNQKAFAQIPKVIKSPWGRRLLLDRTRVMGIINVTPDSFYENSRKQTVEEILLTAGKMIREGADILDIGGMSTRPGSDPVAESEEEKRILPAVKAIRENYPDIMISVDTYRANVAQKALDAGADIVNDISGFAFDSDLIEVIAQNRVPYILMHIKGTPKDMQKNPGYTDLMAEMMEYFAEKIDFLTTRHVDEDQILIDPGIGFGKRVEDNLEILYRMEEFKQLQKPILIAASRKSFIGKVLSLDSPAERLEGTLAVTALCAWRNIDMVRVHDVKENVRIIQMVEAIKCRGQY